MSFLAMWLILAHLPISYLACGKEMVAGKKVAQESVHISLSKLTYSHSTVRKDREDSERIGKEMTPEYRGSVAVFSPSKKH